MDPNGEKILDFLLTFTSGIYGKSKLEDSHVILCLQI